MNVDILKQRAKAFDYVFDAIVVTDLQGFIIDWNKGSETLYGYSKEQAIGQPVNMLHVPGDTEHITSEVISAVENQGKWTGEIRMLHKDGHIGWIESMCVPIYGENYQMVGALGINRDITKRKKE
nr:Chain A, Sensory box/GGDEF domain protein [Colwellia psychrerythraea 34H]3LYX_B Chain B, Sensory box/GGDEF domain protein [Colwellia psychrerythraea 34H]